jgi:hypothetical protein
MKHVFSIWALVLISISLLMGQTTFQGVSVNGRRGYDYNAEKSLGLIAAWNADQGVVLSNSTNVQAWVDATGNGFVFRQDVQAKQPALIKDYTTNHFPVVIFGNDTSLTPVMTNFLYCDGLAQKFSGTSSTKPISFVLLACAQTNNSATSVWGLGWSGATNVSASQIHFKLNSTATTTKTWSYSHDTNSAVANYQKTGGSTTNVFTWSYGIFDGSTIQVGENLSFNAGSTIPNNNVTLDNATLGGLRKANNAFLNPWRGGICEFLIFTNGLSGTTITNIVNNYDQRRSVYTPP